MLAFAVVVWSGSFGVNGQTKGKRNSTLTVSRTYADWVAKISRVANSVYYNLYVPFKILLSSLCFPSSLLKIECCEKKKIQITTMSRNHPSPPSPNAPSSDVTNDAVAFALLPPPSPLSPASPQRSGATNLFQECSEKRAVIRWVYPSDAVVFWRGHLRSEKLLVWGIPPKMRSCPTICKKNYEWWGVQ